MSPCLFGFAPLSLVSKCPHVESREKDLKKKSRIFNRLGKGGGCFRFEIAMENRWGLILLLVVVSLPWPRSVSSSSILGVTSEEEDSPRVLVALSYPSIRIGPYNWRYFRVEVPSAFAELSISLTRKWTGEHVGNYAGKVPLVCFRLGSPPLPDSVLESPQAAAMAVGKAEYPAGTGKCAWFYSNSSIALTNMQVIAGVWYVGLFSDPQPSRFQSKMISRGNIFTFGIHFSVLGCKPPNLRGRDCSVAVKPLRDGTSDQGLTSGRDGRNGRNGRSARDELDGRNSRDERNGSNGRDERDERDARDGRDGRDGELASDHGRGELRTTSAGGGGGETWTSLKSQGVGPDEWKHFALEVADFAWALQVRVNGTTTGEAKFYVKYGVLPDESDNGTAVGSAPVSVSVPRRGFWYIGVHNADVTRAVEFDLEWCVDDGSRGTTGALNPMERVLVEDAQESPFNSFYGPARAEGQQQQPSSPSSPWFFFSDIPRMANNATAVGAGNWTYLFVEVPRGAGGAVLSLQLRHVVHATMHVYARFQGLATPDHWDVKATNIKPQKKPSPVEQSHEEEVSLDLVYPAEGVWCIGAHYTKLAGFENPGDGEVVKSPQQQLGVFGRVGQLWRTSVKSFVQLCRRFSERLKGVGEEFRTAVSSYIDSASAALEMAPSGLPGYRTDEGGADVDLSEPLYEMQPLIEPFSKRQDLEAVQMHIRVHGCVNKCSGKGHCVTTYESSRLHFISNCHCDAAHGGIDCSVPLLVPTEQSFHVWALIGSNSAALLPSFWAIRHHAYSEWVSYVASGVSSGFYHSCDAGGWCALSYDTLQFLDFWLSFLVVIMTCLSVAALKQDTKAVAHIATAIITAAITKESATSAWNVLLVVLMGLAGLLLGWALECWRLRLLPSWFRAIGPNLRPVMRMNSIYHRVEQLLGVIRARFRWLYLFSGLGILLAAGLSWVLETADTYWIWHSLWHLSIYTSAFLILCSTSKSSWRLSEGNALGNAQGYERANLQSPSDPEALPSLLHPVELDAFINERDRTLDD